MRQQSHVLFPDFQKRYRYEPQQLCENDTKTAVVTTAVSRNYSEPHPQNRILRCFSFAPSGYSYSFRIFKKYSTFSIGSPRNTAEPETRMLAPASMICLAFSLLTPPSTSTSTFKFRYVIALRIATIFCVQPSIYFCPPNPVLTVMISTLSTLSR